MPTKPRTEAPYVPALGYRWLTRFYDPVLAWLLKEEKFKALLIEQAGLRPGQRILDLGCGTGTLTIMLKRACPEAAVVGLDGDPETLAIARKKAKAAGAEIELREGMAFDPPLPAGSFDRVVSSLVFHHLTRENKNRTLAAVRRLLRPGGELHVADWGEARSLLMRVAFLSVQLFDGFETTADNVAGMLLPMMEETGFLGVAETHHQRTMFGTLSLYRAAAP